MVVSGAVALVCAGEDIAVDVDGSALAMGTGDVDHKDDRAVKLLGIDFFVGENVVADFLAVVDDVPELLLHFPYFIFCESGRDECSVRLFVGSDEDEAAVGIGECGIGLPEAVRKSAFGFLGFKAVVFPVCVKSFYIEHGVWHFLQS